MKKKAYWMLLAAAGASLLMLAACSPEEPAASSGAESSITSETSASLGIYVQDTDGDGTPDKVVDRYGADLGHLYTLKEDGIYENEALLLPMAQTETFVPVTELAFTVTEKTVHPDPENAFALDLVITPEDATTKEIELTTDNADVLKIENGSITPLANGEATVTATAKAGGAAATCKVVVNDTAEEAETQNTAANPATATTTTTGTQPAANNTAVNNQTTATQPNTNTGNTTPTQPQTPAQPETPAQPQPTVHDPIYTQQWVVDQAAWTEEKPIYTTKVIDVCNSCGADITDDAYAHTYQHLINGDKKAGYHSETIKSQSGTETIYHEEVGHWGFT